MTAVPAGPALLIAAHGTRDPAGVAACHALVDRVRGMLPGVRVAVSFVELVEPGIAEALRELLLAGGPEPEAVVVPLMLGTGGHVQEDIPEAVAQAQHQVPEAKIGYAGPLGADPRLLSAVHARIAAAAAGPGEAWDLRDAAVIVLGRGAKVAQANADHVALTRLIYEQARPAAAYPAFIQVTRPSLPEALGQAETLGARRIVVAPNFLLPGLLRTWTAQQVGAWSADHPQTQVRVAEVIGDCDELAAVVVERYRQGCPGLAPEDRAPVYLAGLVLAGRPVLVVGGGRVADRRVPTLLAAGARVRLVSPTVSVRLRRLLAGAAGQSGQLQWEQRGYRGGDVQDAWYVLAATNDPSVNAAVAAEALAQRVFCVRADAAREGTAWTPATTSSAGMTVAVIGNRDPARSVQVRDAVAKALHG